MHFCLLDPLNSNANSENCNFLLLLRLAQKVISIRHILREFQISGFKNLQIHFVPFSEASDPIKFLSLILILETVSSR